MPTKPPARRGQSGVPPTPGIFHRRGLAYFWVFNDRCDPEALQPQIDAFARAGGVSALCLHPRPGLLLPYGSSDWFGFIRDICARIAKAGLPIWLYDEDPYPSGAAGGRVFAENPAFNARHVERHVFDPAVMDHGGLFAFSPGELLWCGLINEETGEAIDHTARVGMVRRRWQTWENWDSRYFYPDTPIYKTRRADTSHNEMALVAPPVPPGMKLVAFTAVPTVYEWLGWGGLHDTLNPAATRRFIELTHEKYKDAVGDMFGREIKAIFTDEPKYFSKQPWTPGMAEAFEASFGYDIRPRLFHLFSDSMSDEACLTRLHWREHCGKRFEKAWLEPVSRWCARHKLNLVGHISPEDDPVEQANCVSNLFPLFKHFSLAGIDLIIPAVGDARHPIINVGCTAAGSYAQQHRMMGVMSETGACAGNHADPRTIGRILRWQTVMGVTSPLIHCAYSSVEGPRAYEYPPNYGPNAADSWPGMTRIHRELADLQTIIHDARQLAPAAILWPIRAFQIENIDWLTDPTGMRRSLTGLLSACLDRQVGTHILDEEVLWNATLGRGELIMGLARYTHVLLPATSVLHARTVARLKAAQKAGVVVTLAGPAPTRQQSARGLEPLDMSWCPATSPAAAAAELPRLIEIPGDAADIRCTAWEKGGKVTRLLMSLRDQPVRTRVGNKMMTLAPGKVYILK